MTDSPGPGRLADQPSYAIAAARHGGFIVHDLGVYRQDEWMPRGISGPQVVYAGSLADCLDFLKGELGKYRPPA